MKYQRSGAFSRKSLRRSSILSLLATLIGSVAFAALPRAAWADAPPVTIVTPDQVPTLLANGLAAGDVAGTQASFVAPAEDVAAVVAAAAPVEAGQPLLARSVMPLQSQYFVSDVTGTATDMTTTVYTVPRAGGSSTVLETAVGTIANGMFRPRSIGSAVATAAVRTPGRPAIRSSS